MLEDGGDALVIERADLDRADGDRLRSYGIDAAIESFKYAGQIFGGNALAGIGDA